MGKITRTVHVAHDKGHLLGGLLHYVMAASNHVAKGYRRGVRGRDLYRLAVHRTGVYQSRFADYIIADVRGSHTAWRTNQLANPHARAPHYHNPAAQTDCFEMAFDDTSKRWDGSPAIHVAVYGMGRQDRTWMAFRVPPYLVEQLTRPGVTPKTVRLTRDEIYVTYERVVPDREPTAWAGVDMNADNNTYALADGRVVVEHNDFRRQYNRACSKILRVKRRSDIRVMAKHQQKAWNTYHNRIKNAIGVEARRTANAGVGLGYEELNIHGLYDKNGRMAPYVRGRLKTALNTGQRRRALTDALSSAGLPHVGVDPAGTSANCLMCGSKLRRSASQPPGRRNLWCQPCRAIRERDANAGANILFRTVAALVIEYTGRDGSTRVAFPAMLAMLRDAVNEPGMNPQQKNTLTDILRMLEGRSAGAEWRLPGAHKPGRRSSAGGKPAGGPGVDDHGRNGPGPPNAAKLCVYA